LSVHKQWFACQSVRVICPNVSRVTIAKNIIFAQSTYSVLAQLISAVPSKLGKWKQLNQPYRKSNHKDIFAPVQLQCWMVVGWIKTAWWPSRRKLRATTSISSSWIFELWANRLRMQLNVAKLHWKIKKHRWKSAHWWRKRLILGKTFPFKLKLMSETINIKCFWQNHA